MAGCGLDHRSSQPSRCFSDVSFRFILVSGVVMVAVWAGARRSVAGDAGSTRS